MLALFAIMWIMFATLMFVKLCMSLYSGNNQLVEWAVVISVEAALLFFLYKVMIIGNRGGTDYRRSWSNALLVVFVSVMLMPNTSAVITGLTLKLMKLGGGYESSYVLTKTFCEQTPLKICKQNAPGSVLAKLMLDSGNKIYIELTESQARQEGKQILLMIPSAAIVSQKL